MIPAGGGHALEAQRRANREQTRALGFEPYGERVDDLEPIAQARTKHDPAADVAVAARGKEPGFVDPRPTVHVAGRMVALSETEPSVLLSTLGLALLAVTNAANAFNNIITLQPFNEIFKASYLQLLF